MATHPSQRRDPLPMIPGMVNDPQAADMFYRTPMKPIAKDARRGFSDRMAVGVRGAVKGRSSAPRPGVSDTAPATSPRYPQATKPRGSHPAAAFVSGFEKRAGVPNENLSRFTGGPHEPDPSNPGERFAGWAGRFAGSSLRPENMALGLAGGAVVGKAARMAAPYVKGAARYVGGKAIDYGMAGQGMARKALGNLGAAVKRGTRGVEGASPYPFEMPNTAPKPPSSRRVPLWEFEGAAPAPKPTGTPQARALRGEFGERARLDTKPIMQEIGRVDRRPIGPKVTGGHNKLMGADMTAAERAALDKELAGKHGQGVFGRGAQGARDWDRALPFKAKPDLSMAARMRANPGRYTTASPRAIERTMPRTAPEAGARPLRPRDAGATDAWAAALNDTTPGAAARIKALDTPAARMSQSPYKPTPPVGGGPGYKSRMLDRGAQAIEKAKKRATK